MTMINIKKYLSLFILFTLNTWLVQAQNNEDFKESWKQIEAFDAKGLPKSSQKLVLDIFNQAIKTDNYPQQIKAAMSLMKYRNQVEEENKENNIFYLDTLIAQTKAPAKNILQSMQAELFNSYMQNNRYRLYGRTALEVENSKDIRTWSFKKLNETTVALYEASLQPETLLQKEAIEKWNPILIKGANTRKIRPSLYDLLANRALQYFRQADNYTPEPAYKFIINDARFLADVSTFIALPIATKDTASLQLKTLKLFQKLLALQVSKKNDAALTEINLDRLEYVYNQAAFPGKMEAYEKSLLAIYKTNKIPELVAGAGYRLANLYFTKGNEYEASTRIQNRYELKKAAELALETYNKYPETDNGKSAYNLYRQILQPEYSIASEEVVVPNLPFKNLLNYKNTSKLYFKIVKTSKEELAALEKIQATDYNDYWKKIASLKALKTFTLAPPETGDYQRHSVEFKMDALAAGNYLVISSLNENFSSTNNILVKQLIQVSDIAYFTREKDIYVVNRNSGKPLAGATLQTWVQKYNASLRINEKIKAEKYTANKDGYIKLKSDEKRVNYNYQFQYNNEELFTADSHYDYYNYYQPQNRKDIKQSFLFLDRAIYRPGQTIFFKGILVSTDSTRKNNKVIANEKVTVALFDANRQKINTLKLTSNEYGSFTGNFILPEGLLNGQFFITEEVTKNSKYFSVEEYKRPKFSVEIKKPLGSYRVNDDVTVTGNAKAFAGNVIDGAAVSYRVVRKVSYPMWWSWARSFWPPMGSSEEMEITNGKTQTDAEGNFEIIFKAIPDETVAKENQPIFNYEITADVTDINGETHSNTETVSVAYQALQINVVGAGEVKTDSLQQIKISSSNINGLFEPATVHLEMFAVTQPITIYKERYWQIPDTFLMSKKEHDQLFPFDAYSNENEMTAWAVGKKVLEATQKTKEDNSFTLPPTKLKSGWYKIIISTKDKYGEAVKAEKFIKITEEQSNNIAKAISIEVSNENAAPGQEVSTKITTAFDQIYLVQLLNRNDKTTQEVKTLLENKWLVTNYSITKDDLGGFSFNYAFVKHNRIYSGSETINIPWKEKDLNIRYENFRDKLLPGSEEKWTIHVSGNDKDKVAAEMLLGMYDASLDEFVPQSWGNLKNLWPTHYAGVSWKGESFGQTTSVSYFQLPDDSKSIEDKIYDQLENNGWKEIYYYFASYNRRSMVTAAPMMSEDKMAKSEVSLELEGMAAGQVVSTDTTSITSDGNENKAPKINAAIPIRTNLQETAFFFPQLQTDKEGNLSFSFTMPEALTAWKMMALAHTKDLASDYNEKMLVTQKPLMVQPNAPRFLREGDQMEFSAKIVNLTNEEITGTAQLELLDAATNNPVDGYFNNIFPSQYFTVAAGASAVVQFPISVPVNFGSALYYRIKAISKDGQFSDGEAAALPVLTNRMLVTETLPLNMRQTNNKQFTFEKLLNSANSGSLTNQSLTVEYSSNPAWYAVQSLPYLMEYPYDCAEQTFNRFYANALAENMVSTMPKIKAVFDKWNTSDTAALLSNLQKNEELKSALLQETPWVLQAKSEAQQKKNIALLFQMSRLAKEQAGSLQKLMAMQNADGSFPWFKGGPSDRYITQYIVTGIGRLKKLGAVNSAQMDMLLPIVNKGMVYLDEQLKKDYDYLIKNKADLKKDQLSNIAIQYLYMRSLFANQSFYKNTKVAYDFYFGQSKSFWLTKGKYLQGMIAIALQKSNEVATAKAILKSLKENAIVNEEMGMYWKDFSNRNYYWYQAPIESQALLIEAFTEVDKNEKTIDDLKTWLLKQKQTQNWQSTKATADAVYALLLGGSNWLTEEKEVSIQLGNYTIDSKDQKQEAGTGYFKETIPGNKVQAGMGNIVVNIKEAENKKSSASSWGAVYWQYFEDLDKITSAESPLSLTKKLFKERNTATGPVLEALQDGEDIKVGDKIKVRITLKSDRDMEYVHMKDMRASSFEPVNVLSGYKWQGGLGYYESTKDASTQFFFNWLPKGTYVFEYDLFASQKGNFSNGVTSIQCMYAPEFSSHSEGIRVKVK